MNIGYSELKRISSAISSAAERISPIIKLSRVFDLLMLEIAYPG